MTEKIDMMIINSTQTRSGPNGTDLVKAMARAGSMSLVVRGKEYDRGSDLTVSFSIDEHEIEIDASLIDLLRTLGDCASDDSYEFEDYDHATAVALELRKVAKTSLEIARKIENWAKGDGG